MEAGGVGPFDMAVLEPLRHGTTNLTHGKTMLSDGKTKLTHGRTPLIHGKTTFTKQSEIYSRQNKENELVSGCYLHLKWCVV